LANLSQFNYNTSDFGSTPYRLITPHAAIMSLHMLYYLSLDCFREMFVTELASIYAGVVILLAV